MSIRVAALIKQIPAFEEMAHRIVWCSVATVAPDVIEVERGTYFVLAQRNALTLSMTLGNEFNVTMPEPVDLSVFCLGGLGIQRPREWHDDVDSRLDLSGEDGRSILRRLAKGPKSAG